MHRRLLPIAAVLAVLAPLPAAELNRGDAAAVAQAFLAMVQAGEHESALKLTKEDRAVRLMVNMVLGSAEAQLDAWLTASALIGASKSLPAFQFGEPQAGDNEVVVPLTQQIQREAMLVLVKDDQGQYTVDLRATLLRSIRDEQSRQAFEGQLKQFESSQMAGAQTEQPENYKVYQAQGNLYQISQALNDFAAERGAYPEAVIWMDELLPYLENNEKVFHDTVHADEQYSFAFNVELSGKPPSTDWQEKNKQPLVASVAGNLPNALFVPADLAKEEPRYGNINVVMMASQNNLYLGKGETPEDVAANEKTSQEAQQQLRALIKASKAYADQHGGKLPDADKWTDQIQPLIDNKGLPNGTALASPFTEDTRCAYAINPELAGKDLKTLVNHRKLLLFLEVEPGEPNRSATPADDGPKWHRQRWQASAQKVRYGGYLNGDTRPLDEG